jgi:predicted metalloprotease with PDZ domain
LTSVSTPRSASPFVRGASSQPPRRRRSAWTAALLVLGSIGSLIACKLATAASPRYYDAAYRVTFQSGASDAQVELKLSGEQLPSKIVLLIDPQRHRAFSSNVPLEIDDQEVVWRPKGKQASLRYRFVVNHQRTSGSYDSYITRDWALFRGDKLSPRTRVTAAADLHSRTTLEFDLPKGWSAVTPYSAAGELRFAIDDPKRRFDEPEGWMLVGKIGVRSERIQHVTAVIAAPEGDKARRQDALAFINWNLPQLLEVFPQFPKRVLIVSAGDPMWRGGLSGPASIFLHTSRPLISENRTSPLLHELVHVALGIRGDHESDWIVEGLAEFYSIQTLRRSGGISQRRYEQAVENLQRWAQRAPTLFTKSSTGPTTARAVLVFQRVDSEIRGLTGNAASLDDVARKLAAKRGEVSLALLQDVAREVAGKPLQSLQRQRLMKPLAEPAQ